MNTDLCFVFNADSLRFCWVSEAVAQHLGYKRQELLSLPVTQVFPQLQIHPAFLALIREDASSVALKSAGQPMGGSAYAELLELENFTDRGNRYVHARINSTENADLDQRLRQELAKNQKSFLLLQQQAKLAAMGEMIGNIAHQWRQPLNALAVIMMNLDDALAYGEADKQVMHLGLARCQEILSDMSRTIDEFRGFFKNDKYLIEAGLTESIKTCMNLLQASMVYHRIKLVFMDEGYQARVMIQVGEFSQALLCLINNAKEQLLDKQVANGMITISLESEGPWAVMHVTDNAGGISEENLPKIFDPYFTTKPNGTGLGLYFSNLSIQETMSGRMEAKNCAGGARFSVYLPQTNTPEQEI